jgi:CHRD domain-containing protein/PKD domain-containing protein
MRTPVLTPRTRGGRRLPLLVAIAAAIGVMLVAAPSASASASFTALPNPQIAGENISFSGSAKSSCSGSWFAQCDADTWEWDFGDGTTTSGSPTVSHRYMTPGNYTVTFRGCYCHYVSDWQTTSQTIRILPPDKTRSVTLTTPMSGAEQSETFAADPDATGFATMTFYPDAAQVCYNVSFANINTSPALLGHIHKSPRGQSLLAPEMQWDWTSSSSPSSGCERMSPLTIQDIIANPTSYYVQLHNLEYPSGVMRGQLGD